MNDATPERWLPVPGYESLYEVSDHGRVRSLPRQTVSGIRGGTMLKGHKLFELEYVQVFLHAQDRGTPFCVHHLVALAFIGPRPDGMEVRHLDGDASNNAAANLEYGTRADNMQDMLRHHRGQIAKTHCPYDHEYTEENTRLYRGGRFCRACERDRSRHRQPSGPPCTTSGCDTPQTAKGLCPRCYAREWQRRKRAQNT